MFLAKSKICSSLQRYSYLTEIGKNSSKFHPKAQKKPCITPETAECTAFIAYLSRS